MSESHRGDTLSPTERYRKLEIAHIGLKRKIAQAQKALQECELWFEEASIRLEDLRRDILGADTISTTDGKSSSRIAETRSSNPETLEMPLVLRDEFPPPFWSRNAPPTAPDTTDS